MANVFKIQQILPPKLKDDGDDYLLQNQFGSGRVSLWLKKWRNYCRKWKLHSRLKGKLSTICINYTRVFDWIS